MAALFSFIVIIVSSLLVVRVASVALMLTGVSRDLARFQARSAFTGAGFTTSESEKVVHHPVRRRIVMLLMLLGNAGLVTAASALILTFVNTSDDEATTFFDTAWFRIMVIATGLIMLWFFAHGRWIDRRVTRIIAWALRRWTTIDARDYAGLLHLSSDFAVAEIQVRPGDWIADRELRELELNQEGVLVLGIERDDGRYIGTPRAESALHAGDIAILYGRIDAIRDLDQRRAGAAGNLAHATAISEQKKHIVEEREAEDEEER